MLDRSCSTLDGISRDTGSAEIVSRKRVICEIRSRMSRVFVCESCECPQMSRPRAEAGSEQQRRGAGGAAEGFVFRPTDRQWSRLSWPDAPVGPEGASVSKGSVNHLSNTRPGKRMRDPSPEEAHSAAPSAPAFAGGRGGSRGSRRHVEADRPGSGFRPGGSANPAQNGQNHGHPQHAGDAGRERVVAPSSKKARLCADASRAAERVPPHTLLGEHDLSMQSNDLSMDMSQLEASGRRGNGGFFLAKSLSGRRPCLSLLLFNLLSAPWLLSTFSDVRSQVVSGRRTALARR